MGDPQRFGRRVAAAVRLAVRTFAAWLGRLGPVLGRGLQAGRSSARRMLRSMQGAGASVGRRAPEDRSGGAGVSPGDPRGPARPAPGAVPFFRSLRFQILVRFFIVIVFIAIGLQAVVTPTIAVKLEERIMDQMRSKTQNTLARLSAFHDMLLDEIKAVAQSFGKTESENEAMLAFLNIKSASKQLRELALIDLDGRVVARLGFSADGEKVGDGVSFKNEPFFEGGQNKDGYVGPLEPNKAIPTIFEINYAAPALDLFDRVRYVLAAKVNIQLLWPTLRGQSIQGQTVFLLTRDGLVAAADDDRLLQAQMFDAEGTALPREKWNLDLIRKDGAVAHYFDHKAEAEAGKVFALKTKNAFGEPVLAAYAADPVRGYAVFVEMPQALALGPVRDVSRLMLIVLLAGVVFLVLGALLTARSVTRPVAHLLEATEAVGQGDLTVKIALPRQDELGRLAAAFDRMVGDLRSLVRAVQANAAASEQAAERFRSAFDDVAAATEQVAQTIEEIARGAEEHAQIAQKTDESVHALDRHGALVAERVEAIHRRAEQAMAALAQSAAALDGLVAGVERASATSAEHAEAVRTLADKMRSIVKIAAAVGEIASRTNLLALNAAIEAARAGEHGRGFAVVAAEVRKLAESSAESAREIEAIVRDVLRTMEAVEQAITAGAAAIAREGEGARAARETFSGLEALMQEVEQAVGEIVRAVEEEKALIRALAEEAQTAAALAEETSAGAEEVAASSEETSATIGDLKKTLAELVDATRSLRERVERFRV
ncbi:MAG: methyl-accepting chemotaxis protein [Hydrogenibacillus schlegelii]|uniref:Methyl-accepting chemotaxis protein n=2 Tax=Hydrogenibacillus schlegelii TaxID=1484 RepID=A0A947D3H8_HYDSH|nr:methyl-accepting chemotaxis protein [Hydrogenibacillus schlegelii]